MSDIDFDELDKAVNSVMSVTPLPAAEAPSETSLPTETPEVASVVPEASPPVAEKAAASLAKRRGRFMDVVHPSSDMKTSTPAAKPQSREGIAIAIAPATQSDQQGEVVEPKATTPELPSKQIEQEEPLGDKELKTDSEPVGSDDTTDLLSSPFLPDAKVEKRPLGGQSNDKLADEMARLNDSNELQAETTESSVDTPIETSTTEADKPTSTSEGEVELTPPSAAETEAQPAPLPAELSSDLVAIESGDATSQSMTSEAEPAEPTPQPDNEEPLQKSSKQPAETKKTETVAPISGSIAQQYKETPTTNQETHASIYDTHTDIAPLEHLTKKKTSWLYVILIVVALLIGGGGGAAVYFLNLI